MHKTLLENIENILNFLYQWSGGAVPLLSSSGCAKAFNALSGRISVCRLANRTVPFEVRRRVSVCHTGGVRLTADILGGATT